MTFIAVDGLTAGALGISRVAVRVRLHRSRKRLREILAKSAPLAPTKGAGLRAAKTAEERN